jgi:hypothetical protein
VLNLIFGSPNINNEKNSIISALIAGPAGSGPNRNFNFTYMDSQPERANIDWLLSAPKQQAELYRDASNKTITIDNGLLKRSFRIAPNLACIEFLNQTNGEQMLRAVSPEARITINGTIYNVGGLFGQLEKGYFKSDWIDGLKINRNDFFFHHLEVSALKPYINWKTVKMGWSLNISPAKGKMVSFVFTSANQLLKGIKVTVNYEVYNGCPSFANGSV